jgi:hypothetical protein
MKHDRLLAYLDEVDQARRALIAELESLGEAMAVNRRMRLDGRSVVDIFRESQGPEARRRVRQAWVRLNEALHTYRAYAVRCIVDEDGWTLTMIARSTGNARQVISRLYHFALRSTEPPSRETMKARRGYRSRGPLPPA